MEIKENAKEGNETESNKEENNSEPQEAGMTLRQSLPRASKEGHKFLSTNASQGARIPNPTTMRKCQQKNL